MDVNKFKYALFKSKISFTNKYFENVIFRNSQTLFSNKSLTTKQSSEKVKLCHLLDFHKTFFSLNNLISILKRIMLETTNY